MNRTLLVRSPVGAIFSAAGIFYALFSWSYFALGATVLISAIVALTFYFRPKLSPIVLTLLLAFPIYTVFFDSPQGGSFLLGDLAVSLLMIALISSFEDWLGALVGLWLGLMLAVSATVLLVLPVLAVLVLYKGIRGAVVGLRMFVLFGMFFLIAPELSYVIPSTFKATTSMFFPNLNALPNTGPFAALFQFLLGPQWSTSIHTSIIASILGYFPLYFVVITALFVVAIHYGKRLASLLPLNPRLSEILIATAISIAAGAALLSSATLIITSALVTTLFAFCFVAIRPLLQQRPQLQLSAFQQLFGDRFPVIQAQQFNESEGVLVENKPGKSDSMKQYWDKTVGTEEIKQNLIKTVALPLKNKKEAGKFGVKPAKGVLLYGPPGTGKSTLLRGLASVLDMRYVEVSPGDILSKWYGESEQRMKKIFDDAMGNPPCILAIDEIDSIGKDRRGYSGDDVTPRVLNLVLIGLDKIFQSDLDVVVVATTNKPQMLDNALLRPGRFDNIQYLGPPNEKARVEIFRQYLEGKSVIAPDIDYERLAKLSERFTGADIEGVITKVLANTFYEKTGKKTGDQKSATEAAITQQILEAAVISTRPTLTFSMLEEYEAFRVEFQRERRIQKGWESEIPNVKFDDIGDLDSVKVEIREAFEVPLTKPDLMEKLKIRPVKGVLLYGPPGNGKTLLAKAIANEIFANFFVVSGADLARGSPGESAAKIKEVFNVAKENAPAIIFIDEIDQVAPDRSNPIGVAYIPVTTQLLSELDGVRELRGVMVLAATNRPNQIDAALLRANRLEKHIEVPFPPEQARKQILELCLKGVEIDVNVSMEKLAHSTEGFSGADLQEFVNEAKKVVLRRSLKGDQMTAISQTDFAEALDSKRRSVTRKQASA